MNSKFQILWNLTDLTMLEVIIEENATNEFSKNYQIFNVILKPI